MYVDAVDEGDAVALRVRYGEVDRVAVVVRWGTVGERRGRPFWVEECGSGGEIGFGEEVCGGDFRDCGVGDPPVCVCEGDA